MTQRGWRPPNYTVDEHGKIVGREPPAPPHNWGRWGDDDQIGTLNNVTPADIVGAAGLVRKGKVFSLGLSLKEPIQSGLFGGRWNLLLLRSLGRRSR